MIKSEDNSEHYTWGSNCDGWHLVKTKSLSVIKERVPPGCSEVSHLHQKAEQFVYILNGQASIEIDGIEHILNANQGIHVPAGVPHQFHNKSANEVVFIVTSTPPSHGDRVEV